jgi:hypothetical protein
MRQYTLQSQAKLVSLPGRGSSGEEKKNENFNIQYETIQINTNNILHRIIKIKKFSHVYSIRNKSGLPRV